MNFMDSYSIEERHITKLKALIRERFHKATAGEERSIGKLERTLLDLDVEAAGIVRKNSTGALNDRHMQRELARIDAAHDAAVADLAILRNTNVSPEEALAFCEEYLTAPSQVWRKAEIGIKTKLQAFQFPSGVEFDGQVFGTTEICSIFKDKRRLFSAFVYSGGPYRIRTCDPLIANEMLLPTELTAHIRSRFGTLRLYRFRPSSASEMRCSRKALMVIPTASSAFREERTLREAGKAGSSRGNRCREAKG